MQGNNYQVDSAPLLGVPIYKPETSESKCIERLVDFLLLELSQGQNENESVIQFLENVIDACIFECYFHDYMHDRGLLFHAEVMPLLENYTPDATEQEQKKIVEQFYKTANAPDHTIRNRLLRLTADSPDLLAVIKEHGAV